MRDILTASAILLLVILVVGYRERVLEALRRFDAKNAERRLREASDRRDRLAHFRHTLELAGEQVEDVGEIVQPDARTGTPQTFYLFQGETFFTRDEAEVARNEVVVAMAREFYKELPAALARRGNGKIGRD